MRTTSTFPTKTFKPAAMALAVATTLSACLGGGGGTSAPDFNAGGTGIGSNSRATIAESAAVSYAGIKNEMCKDRSMLCAGRDDVAVTDRDAKIKAPRICIPETFQTQMTNIKNMINLKPAIEAGYIRTRGRDRYRRYRRIRRQHILSRTVWQKRTRL